MTQTMVMALIDGALQRLRARQAVERFAQRNATFRTGFASVGRPVRIGETVEISPLDQVSIGDNVVIHGPGNIWAAGGLTIGSNVAIAQGCSILTTNHMIEGDALPWAEENTRHPIVIEDNVWIGLNVILLPGVTVHEGAVIGAGSVVTKDVPKCAIAAGNPARVIRYRDLERYERLKAESQFRIIPTDISEETLVTR